jgi:hypothetical protein
LLLGRSGPAVWAMVIVDVEGGRQEVGLIPDLDLPWRGGADLLDVVGLERRGDADDDGISWVLAHDTFHHARPMLNVADCTW